MIGTLRTLQIPRCQCILLAMIAAVIGWSPVQVWCQTEPTLSVDQLVFRSLETARPDSECQISVDGVKLPDGSVYAWWEILGASSESSQEQWQFWNQKMGRPWFLLKSRLERGETLAVEQLSQQLLEHYQLRDGKSVSYGELQLRRWLCQHWASQGKYDRALEQFAEQCELAQRITSTDSPWQSLEVRYQLGAWIDDPESGISLMFAPPFWQKDSKPTTLPIEKSPDWSMMTQRKVGLYQFLSAATEDGTPLASQFSALGDLLNPEQRERWRSIFDNVNAPLTSESRRQFWSTVASSQSWGEELALCWMVGNRWINSEDPETWKEGSVALLRVAMICQQKNRDRSDVSPWTRYAVQRVIDKYQQQGSPGSLVGLRGLLGDDADDKSNAENVR